jgi:hypothetical protein
LKKNRDAVIGSSSIRASAPSPGPVRSSKRRAHDDAGTPQAALEKGAGAACPVYGRREDLRRYYRSKGWPSIPPGGTEPLQIPYKPFKAGRSKTAVTDTTVYRLLGASAMAEAAYDFELALLIDSKSSDIYKNLATSDVLGRTDDAIHAAQIGLSIKPDDKQLTQNLRVAALGRGNRLFASGNTWMPCPRTGRPWRTTPRAPSYFSRIAESYQLAAQP